MLPTSGTGVTVTSKKPKGSCEKVVVAFVWVGFCFCFSLGVSVYCCSWLRTQRDSSPLPILPVPPHLSSFKFIEFKTLFTWTVSGCAHAHLCLRG